MKYGLLMGSLLLASCVSTSPSLEGGTRVDMKLSNFLPSLGVGKDKFDSKADEGILYLNYDEKINQSDSDAQYYRTYLGFLPLKCARPYLASGYYGVMPDESTESFCLSDYMDFQRRLKNKGRHYDAGILKDAGLPGQKQLNIKYLREKIKKVLETARQAKSTQEFYSWRPSYDEQKKEYGISIHSEMVRYEPALIRFNVSLEDARKFESVRLRSKDFYDYGCEVIGSVPDVPPKNVPANSAILTVKVKKLECKTSLGETHFLYTAESGSKFLYR